MPKNFGQERTSDYHDPQEQHEPKDFSDALDHMDF